MCTANSCRSQMAEGWARRLFPAEWEVASCGMITHPITRETREAMAEVQIDLADQHTKSLDAVDLESFDLVVTLSRTAGRYLPRLRRPGVHRPMPISDPMATRGTDEEVRDAFRGGRERIRSIVEEIVAGRLGLDQDVAGDALDAEEAPESGDMPDAGH
jgi:arsenate reductase